MHHGIPALSNNEHQTSSNLKLKLKWCMVLPPWYWYFFPTSPPLSSWKRESQWHLPFYLFNSQPSKCQMQQHFWWSCLTPPIPCLSEKRRRTKTSASSNMRCTPSNNIILTSPFCSWYSQNDTVLRWENKTHHSDFSCRKNLALAIDHWHWLLTIGIGHWP